jgi:hypothetical protein
MTSTATGLVSEILDDAQHLAKQQFEMLKAEIREDVGRTKRAIRYGGLGAVLLTVGGLALVASIVNLLHEQFGFSMWASCLIIGGMLSAAGLALAAAAWSLFETFSPLPEKTIDSLKENITWSTQPQA